MDKVPKHNSFSTNTLQTPSYTYDTRAIELVSLGSAFKVPIIYTEINEIRTRIGGRGEEKEDEYGEGRKRSRNTGH
jgi:hypothetical protein